MQLINIQYKIDKSDLDRSNQSVQKAKDLTDQLKKASKDQGDQAKKSNKEFQGSIEGVKQKMAQLKAQIELTNRSDNKRLNELIKQYQQAKKQVDEFNKSMKQQQQASQQAVQTTNSLAGGFMNMYNAVKLFIGAAIIRQLVDTTLEAAKLSGQVEAVGNAFRRQIPRSEALLSELRAATQGTVKDIELMQRALKFQNFGGDVQQLPALLEFAAVRAQQTGESVDYMVNSIVNGIGRKSILILDNLGISATRLKGEFNGASLASQSVGDVTRAVSKIAQEELTKMGGFAVNSATKVDQLTVAVNDLKIALSQKLETSGIIDALNDAVKGAKILVETASLSPLQWYRNFEAMAIQEKALKLAIDEVTRVKKEANGTNQEQFDFIQQEINSRVQLIGRYNDTVKALKEEREVLRDKNPYDEKIENIGRTIRGYNNSKLAIQETIRLLKEELRLLQTPTKEPAQVRSLKVLKGELEELNRIRQEDTPAANQAEIDSLARLIAKKEDEILKIEDNIAWQKKWNDQTIITRLAQENLTRSLTEQQKAIDGISNKILGSMPDFNATEKIEIEVDAEIVPDLDFEGEAWARARLGIKEWIRSNRDEMIGTGIDLAASGAQTIVDIELYNYEKRIENLRNFYDQQNSLAGDNERYKMELRVKEQRETEKLEKQLARKQKQARLFSIAIDTAASIAKAWVNPGWPAAIPLSAFLLAQGAVQAAIVQRTPMGFKDGVIDLKGPGTETSDSIRANLSRGESVMTAKETKTSPNILKAIRAKTLDDQKLARIVAVNRGAIGTGGLTDISPLVKATQRVERAIASNDITRKGSIIYEAKKESENFTRYIRSKYL